MPKMIGRVKIIVSTGKPRLVREAVVGSQYKEEVAVPQPKPKMLERAIRLHQERKSEEYPITPEIERWMQQNEVKWL